MRRALVALSMFVSGFVALPIGPSRATAAPLADPRIPNCQPNPLDQTVQRLHCLYGPLTVTPGDNLILVGPVTIESPRAPGYITRLAPNLIDATTGAVPPIHQIHLHHGVWLNVAQTQSFTPFFATGEEKTVSAIPSPYGYPTTPGDAWALNYMLHNLTTATFGVFIVYDLDWVSASSPLAAAMKAVQPVWLDIVGHNDASRAIYPIYNPTNANTVADPTAPSGQATLRTETFQVTTSGGGDVELVWAAGHVHPGGLRDELHAVQCAGKPVAGSPLLFNSRAQLNSPTSVFGSWDFSMTEAAPSWRYHMRSGDQVSVTTAYDAGHPWYEAMGIMFAWAHPLASGEAADASLCQLPATTGPLSDAPNPPNPVPYFGGAQPICGAPGGAAGPAVTSVVIRAFDYSPGGTCQPPAPVAAGQTVTFTNLDAAASIYHTVTSCAYPCNLDYGQAYPLATWPNGTATGGFDSSQAATTFTSSGSGELGFGPPYATAATNSAQWAFRVPAAAGVGTVYTFYCRIHPAMRGSVQVVA